MIRLTINPDKSGENYSFDKDEIIIGSSRTGKSDVNIPAEPLQAIHLKICRRNGSYFVVNVANDPFTTINEAPFGKRTIEHGDIIKIGTTPIRFETIRESKNEIQNPPAEKLHEEKLYKEPTVSLRNEQFADRIENRINSPVYATENKKNIIPEFTSFSFVSSGPSQELSPSPISTLQRIPEKDFEEETQEEELEDDEPEIEDEDEDEIDIDALIKRVENADRNPINIAPDNTELHAPTENNPEHSDEPEYKEIIGITNSYNEEIFNFSGSDSEETGIEDRESSLLFPPPLPPTSGKWKIWLGVFIISASTLLIVSKGVYTRLEEKNHREEIQTAGAVSDIALALTYAHINNIHPQQQNWTDPHFLKNSIYSVLSPHHYPMATVDNNGRLNGGKYLLRIYTNRDISRFIVIAQPEASLMQWISPQKAIVIDSKSMQLHPVSDLKPLNRLLVNPNSLSGDHGREIFDAIKNQSVIPLKSLADANIQSGFEVPKQLGLLNRDAENYVYNAQRYSQVGENIMAQAIDLINRPAGNPEIKKFIDEINTVSMLPDAVLYTSRGMKTALRAQKALAAIVPEQKFHIAYIHFDQSGHIKGSHLILDSEGPAAVAKNGSSQNLLSDPEIGYYQPLIASGSASDYMSPKEEYKSASKNFRTEVDEESVLFKKLSAISEHRQDLLDLASKKLIRLLQKNNVDPSADFFEEFDALFTDYAELLQETDMDTISQLKELYREYDYIPMAEFEEYVQAVGLKELALSHLKQVSEGKIQEQIDEADFTTMLDHILVSENFEDLHQITEESSRFLRLENIPDSGLLIQYQNRLRSAVLEKLNELLLSPGGVYGPNDYIEDNRALLHQILLNAWVIDPEEQNFYLNEYDHLYNQ